MAGFEQKKWRFQFVNAPLKKGAARFSTVAQHLRYLKGRLSSRFEKQQPADLGSPDENTFYSIEF
jgi:hypothetical protein